MGTGAIEIKSGYGLTLEAELKMLRVIKRLNEKETDSSSLGSPRKKQISSLGVWVMGGPGQCWGTLRNHAYA